jgi:hypothetical protein
LEVSDDDYPSPFDRFPGDSLPAGVVDGTRIHGYDVPTDLAAHYNLAELQFLSLTGVVPDEEQGRAFELCQMFLMPHSIAHASAHAGRVAAHVHSILGNSPAAAATVGVGLVEQARSELEQFAPWLAWLDDDGDSAIPPVAQNGAKVESAWVRRFSELLPFRYSDAIGVPAGSINLLAAILTVLRALGVREPQQMTAALVLGRFPAAMAEAFAAPDLRLWSYPLNLPHWEYAPEDE